MLSKNEADLTSEKIERFTRKYKLWAAFALLTSGLLAFFDSPKTWIAFFLVFVLIWLIAWTLGKVLIAAGWLLPKSFSQDDRKRIEEAVITTLFFGAFAGFGIVLRMDNFVLDWLAEKTPIHITISTIDPMSAVIIIVCIWAYAAYRTRRRE